MSSRRIQRDGRANVRLIWEAELQRERARQRAELAGQVRHLTPAQIRREYPATRIARLLEQAHVNRVASRPPDLRIDTHPRPDLRDLLRESR